MGDLIKSMKIFLLVLLFIAGMTLVHFRMLEVEAERCAVWNWEVCGEVIKK